MEESKTNSSTINQSKEDQQKMIQRMISDLEDQSIKKDVNFLNSTLCPQSDFSGSLILFNQFPKNYYDITVSRYFHTSWRRFVVEKVFNCEKKEEDTRARQESIAMLKIILEFDPKLLQIYAINYCPQKSCRILMECGIGTLEDMIEFMTITGIKNISYEDFIDELEGSITDQTKRLANFPLFHNDLHEGNILFREDDYSIILCDFGEAQTQASYSEQNDVGQLVDDFKKKISQQQFEYVTKAEFYKAFRNHQIIKRCEQIPDPIQQAAYIKNLIILMKPEELIKFLQERIDNHYGSNVSDYRVKQMSHFILGRAYRDLGNLGEARANLDKSRDYIPELPENERERQNLMVNIAYFDVYIDDNNLEEAMKCYENVRKHLDNGKNEDLLGELNIRIGHYFSEKGESRTALEYFRKAKAKYSQLNYKDGIVRAKLREAAILLAEKPLPDLGEPTRLLEDCQRDLKNKVTQDGEELYFLLAFCHAILGNTELFEECWRKCTDIQSKISPYDQKKKIGREISYQDMLCYMIIALKVKGKTPQKYYEKAKEKLDPKSENMLNIEALMAETSARKRYAKTHQLIKDFSNFKLS